MRATLRRVLIDSRFASIGPFVIQGVAATMLLVGALMTDALWLSIFDVVLACMIVALSAFVLGRRHAFATLERSIAPMPKSISISEDEDGTKIALIEQQSGDIVTLELPDEIDSSDEAMRYIMEQLSR